MKGGVQWDPTQLCRHSVLPSPHSVCANVFHVSTVRSLCSQPDTGEVGSPEEMEEDVGLKKRKSDQDGEKQTPAGQETGEKVKRKRGRPPAVKLPPNPPELTRMLSMLVDMVINYKDGWGPSVMQHPPPPSLVRDAEEMDKRSSLGCSVINITASVTHHLLPNHHRHYRVSVKSTTLSLLELLWFAYLPHLKTPGSKTFHPLVTMATHTC